MYGVQIMPPKIRKCFLIKSKALSLLGGQCCFPKHVSQLSHRENSDKKEKFPQPAVL